MSTNVREDAVRGFSYTPIQIEETPLELRQVHAAWRAARGAAFAPTRKGFDLMNLPSELIPFTSITDYDKDRDAFRIRFFGTGLVGIDGVDLTGKSLADTPNAQLRDGLFILFRDVVATHRENFAEFNFVTSGGVHSMSVTGRWPLSDDGETVTAILSVVQPEQHVYTLNKILGDGYDVEAENTEVLMMMA